MEDNTKKGTALSKFIKKFIEAKITRIRNIQLLYKTAGAFSIASRRSCKYIYLIAGLGE